MFSLMLLVLCIFPMLDPTTAKHRAMCSMHGHVTVAVFLPLTNGPGCLVENPSGVLYAEAVIYQLEQLDKQHNSTLGCVIFDTCESAEIAGKAASHLLTTMTRNQRNERHQDIVAAIIHAKNMKIVRAIQDKLRNLSQILIKPRSMMSRTAAAADLFKLLGSPRVAILATGTKRRPLFLKLISTTCMADDIILAGDNDIILAGDNDCAVMNGVKQRLDQIKLVLIVARFEKAMATIKKAKRRVCFRNKTWLIITEELHSYHVKEIQTKDHIFVLSKTKSTLSREQFDNFHNHLRQVCTTPCPWKTQSLDRIISYWPSFLDKRLDHSSGSLVLHTVTDIFHAVSQLRLALHEISSRSENGLNVTMLRTHLHYHLTQGNFHHVQCNSSSSHEARCSPDQRPEYTLSKIHINNTCCTSDTLANWTNSSSWNINATTLAFLKMTNKSWECQTGFHAVLLPPNFGKCLEPACLSCHRHFILDAAGHAYCQLCTITKCLQFPLIYVTFSHPIALLITCLCILGELLLILVVVIFTKFRKTPVVKSSNRMFNYFTLTTLGFWFALIPSFLRRPDYVTCNALVAFFPIMYATVSSIQLGKTVRLILIFKSMQQPSKLLGNTSFFFITIGFILLQVILSVLNFIKYPVETETHLQHDAVILYCGQYLSPISALTFTYNCLLSTTCGILAYRARKLPQNFNETKNMSFAILSYTVSWTIIIVGCYHEKFADQQTAVVCLGFAIGGFLVFLSLFFPKLRVILFYPQLNTKSAIRESTRRYSVEVSVNISALRPQRMRSSTFDCTLGTKSGTEPRRMSLNNNNHVYRPRTVSDISFMQSTLYEQQHYSRADTGISELPSSVIVTSSSTNSPMSSV